MLPHELARSCCGGVGPYWRQKALHSAVSGRVCKPWPCPAVCRRRRPTDPASVGSECIRRVPRAAKYHRMVLTFEEARPLSG